MSKNQVATVENKSIFPAQSEQAVTAQVATSEEKRQRAAREVASYFGGDLIKADRFIGSAYTYINRNNGLKSLHPTVLLNAVKHCASYRLPLGSEGFYAVPYADQVELTLSPQGLIEIMYRSGFVSSVEAQVVYDGDEFGVQYQPETAVLHSPNIRASRTDDQIIGAYAVIVLTNGKKLIEVMTKAELDKVRSKSKAKNNGPWVDWFGEMARKSVLKRCAKYVPKSDELRDLIRDDNVAEFDFNDNAPAVQSSTPKAQVASAKGTAGLLARVKANTAPAETVQEAELVPVGGAEDDEVEEF